MIQNTDPSPKFKEQFKTKVENDLERAQKKLSEPRKPDEPLIVVLPGTNKAFFNLK